MLYNLEQALEKNFGCQKKLEITKFDFGHKMTIFTNFILFRHSVLQFIVFWMNFMPLFQKKIKKENAPFSIFNPIFGHQEASDENFDHSVFLVRSSLVGTQSFINLKCPVYGAPSPSLHPMFHFIPYITASHNATTSHVPLHPVCHFIPYTVYDIPLYPIGHFIPNTTSPHIPIHPICGI